MSVEKFVVYLTKITNNNNLWDEFDYVPANLNLIIMKKIFTLVVALASVITVSAEVQQDVIDASNIKNLSGTDFASGNTYVANKPFVYSGKFYLEKGGYIKSLTNPGEYFLKTVEFATPMHYGGDLPLKIYVSNEPMATLGDIRAAECLGTLENSPINVEGDWKYVGLAFDTTDDFSWEYSTITLTWEKGGSGVEGIEAENGEAVYYNLQGVRVENPENGMFIRVQNGKSTKVAIK